MSSHFKVIEYPGLMVVEPLSRAAEDFLGEYRERAWGVQGNALVMQNADPYHDFYADALRAGFNICGG